MVVGGRIAWSLGVALLASRRKRPDGDGANDGGQAPPIHAILPLVSLGNACVALQQL